MEDRAEHIVQSPRFAAQAVLLCVGYGLFHACCFSGPLSTAYFARALATQEQVLWTQMLLLGATGLFCLAVWALARRGVALVRPGASYVCYGLLLAGFALCGATGSIEAVYILSFLIGVAAAIPVLVWFDMLLHIYRTVGRSQCILVLVASILLFLAAGAFADAVSGSPAAASALILGGLAISAGCQCGVSLTSGYGERVVSAASQQPGAPDTPRVSYRLSVYLVAIECSFGVTYGLVRGAVVFSDGGA